MLAAMEAGEVVSLLEGGWGGWREAAEAVGALLGAVRDPWVSRALLSYWARTGSARALELLARLPEPHCRHLLDALTEQLRGESPARRAALAALAPLVARRPAWLPRLAAPPHPLPRDLLRAARLEREPLPLLHALLALAALVPAAPALAAPHWPELADALLRPAALHPPPSPAVRAHLHLAQLALFHALYATHPVTLIETLRAEMSGAGAREAWERELQPLLQSVRLHPALVTGSRASEAEAARRLEEHEIVAETRRLTLYTPEWRAPDEPPPPAAPLGAPPPGAPPALGRAVAALRPGTEPWFALADRCGADSAPHTPLPPEADPGEPPEAAVEATPENTPAKEPRATFRFPSESAAVRALGRRALSARASSPPRSPPPAPSEGAAGAGARLARVMAERRALDSPVLFPPMGGGVPPAGALRVQPHRPTDIDQEVVELTSGATPLPSWEGSPPLAPPRDPRLAVVRPHRPVARRPFAAPAPARRPASAGPAGARTNSVAVQTVDTWPEPYEFLIADFYRNINDDTRNERDPRLACERLDAYLEELYAGRGRGRCAPSEMAEQLALTHAQLVYERWRREAHAERNRRLLGRCRQARAHQLHTHALRDRLRAVTAECEELRARLAARGGGGGGGGGGAGGAGGVNEAGAQGEEIGRLEAALQAERAARARAEARVQEAESGRLAAVREVQASRGEAFEAARHVEALGRAALAAERRAEHVRRLRQELLVLAERDHRLTEAARVPPLPAPGASPLERALRAACARAEAEALSAGARADAATARAHELEASLASRDTLLTELKRAATLSAEESAAKLQALQQRYDTLLRVLRAAEGRKLETLGAAPLGPRAPPPPPPADEDDLPDGS